MQKPTDKGQILRNAGFKFNYDREVYINNTKKIVLSVDAVEDHDAIWLQEHVDKNGNRNGWEFHFNKEPSKTIQQELIRMFQ